MKPKHKRGYPDRYWKDLARVRRRCVVAILIGGTLAFTFTSRAIRDQGSLLLGAFSCGIFVWILLSVAAVLWDYNYHVSIHPYFERKVGDIRTFGRGLALSAELATLDEIAQQWSVDPLSTFGFNDDLRGETLQWHPPEKGLATVEALLKAIQAEPELVRHPAKVVADLERFAHAFRRASEKGNWFCLLLRYNNATNAREWLIRQGEAF